MNDVINGPGATGLVERAKAILLSPKQEWPRIAAETNSIADVFKTYALPLILIGPIATLIGLEVFGINVIFSTWRPDVGTALTIVLSSLVGTIVGLIVLTLIAEYLAPNFGGVANRTNAFKLCAYSMTAGWVAGVLCLIPALAPLALLAALYGLYLLYLGVTPMMKVPQDKAMTYVVVLIIAAIVIQLIIGQITGSMMRPTLTSSFT